MRIDGNQAAQALPESGRTGGPGAVGGGARGSAGTGLLDQDQAQFTGSQGQVQALSQQTLQFPEIRQEKVDALRPLVLGGSYQIDSKQLADALLICWCRPRRNRPGLKVREALERGGKERGRESWRSREPTPRA
jgi:flagellar biosynthesis anti-sigma factor FlgM